MCISMALSRRGPRSWRISQRRRQNQWKPIIFRQVFFNYPSIFYKSIKIIISYHSWFHENLK